MVPHTVIVDFTIALLLTSGICDLLAVVGRDRDFEIVARWCLLFGTVAAVLSVISGYASGSIAPEGTHTAIAAHRNFGIVTAVLALSCAAWRLASGGMPPVRRVGLYWATTLATMTAVIVTAYWGGLLVFRLGVGVFAPQ